MSYTFASVWVIVSTNGMFRLASVKFSWKLSSTTRRVVSANPWAFRRVRRSFVRWFWNSLISVQCQSCFTSQDSSSKIWRLPSLCLAARAIIIPIARYFLFKLMEKSRTTGPWAYRTLIYKLNLHSPHLEPPDPRWVPFVAHLGLPQSLLCPGLLARAS